MGQPGSKRQMPGSEQRDKDGVKILIYKRDNSSCLPGELGDEAPGEDRSGEPGTPCVLSLGAAFSFLPQTQDEDMRKANPSFPGSLAGLVLGTIFQMGPARFTQTHRVWVPGVMSSLSPISLPCSCFPSRNKVDERFGAG